MKRNLFIAAAVFLLSLIITDVVMAAYYIDIDVEESNGTDYDMLAMNVSLDIDYLADNGFIDDDGLDIRLQTSAGSSIPFMPAEDKLMFASAIEGDKTTGFQMTTGNTPLDSFPVIVGDGGHITITDHANLEPADDFEIEIDGYIDTGDSLTLIEKSAAVDIATDGAGNVDATIAAAASDILQTSSVGSEDFSSTKTRLGHRVDDVPQIYITRVSFYLEKDGTPSGTAYARIRRVSDDGIVGTLGSINVETITGSPVWYNFDDDVYNPTGQDVRFTIEYTGADAVDYISARYANDGVTGKRTYYDGSWHDDATHDLSIKIYYAGASVSTAATTDDCIKVAADGSDLKIYKNGSEQDSASSTAVVDNANDWTIAELPYLNYFKLTTSDTLRITYEPDDIISGTTLINETNPGTHDGAITWGLNPAGISIETSGLLLDETYYYTGGEGGTTDIFAPEPAELAPGQDGDKLDHNPLSPGVEGFAAASNGAFTESLVWYGIAWFSVIAVAIALVVLVREHLVLAAAASFGLSIFWYVGGVFDYWVLIIFGIFFGATLIHERMPTW